MQLRTSYNLHKDVKKICLHKKYQKNKENGLCITIFSLSLQLLYKN